MFKKSAFTVLMLAAGIIGCGGGNGASEIRDARDEQIEATREEHEQHAEERQERAEERAEAQRERAEERHEALPEKTQGVADAVARMREQRAIYRSEVVEKVDKQDARLTAAKAKMDNARTTPLAARDHLQAAAKQRDIVRTEIENLTKVSDDQWKDATERLNKQIDLLVELVDKAEASANKL